MFALRRERMSELAAKLQRQYNYARLSDGTLATVLETLGLILEAAPQVAMQWQETECRL